MNKLIIECLENGLYLEALYLLEDLISYYKSQWESKFASIDPEHLNEAKFMFITSFDPTQKNPTSKGSYTDWLVREYLKFYADLGNAGADSKFKTDRSKIREAILNHKKYKEIGTSNPINTYTFNALIDWSNSVSAKKSADEEVVYDDGEWQIRLFNSYESSCKYSKGTLWCTGPGKPDGAGNKEHYDNYQRKGKLYYVEKMDNEIDHKWLFHFETREFKDAYQVLADNIDKAEWRISFDPPKGLLEYFKMNIKPKYFPAEFNPALTEKDLELMYKGE